MSDNALSRRLREIREAEAQPEPGPVVQAVVDDAPEPARAPRRFRLGELLIAKGLISEEALDAALEQQRTDGRPLGQILVASGALTPQNLARTLTEQCGFDFSGSLRDRLATGEHSAETEPEPPVEAYFLCRPGDTEPLHTATSFLDAADLAFELIEDEQPEELEIVRFRDGERECLWSYKRDAGADATASEL
jgi:hypothetical protein